MLSNPHLQRGIIIGFMMLCGFAIAKAFYTGSFIAIVLSFVALGAAIYFVFLLQNARREMEQQMESIDTPNS